MSSLQTSGDLRPDIDGKECPGKGTIIFTGGTSSVLDKLSPIGDDNSVTYEVRQTEFFEKWFRKLRDRQAKASIGRRINRFRLGNFGDTKSVGNDVCEMRVNAGKGYRVYFTVRNETVVFLMNGGDKSTQDTDITRAKEIAREI